MATPAQVSRDDLLALGQRSAPWGFVPLGLQAVRQAPADADLRALLAVHLTQLGLRTLAQEQLDALDAETRADPGVRDLQDAVTGLDNDERTPARRATVCRANLIALRERGVEVDDDAFERWRERIAGERALVASDGNVIVQSADGAWRGLADAKGAAERAELPFQSGDRDTVDAVPSPVVIEGVDPPWLLRRVWRATPDRSVGMRTRVTVVQADWGEFFDGLACVDLRAELADDRVEVLVGPVAGGQLKERLDASMGARLPEAALRLPTVRTPASPPIGETIEAARAEQVRLVHELRAAVEAVYAGRDEAFYADRFASGEPLRVLIPTSRFTTYVRHAAHDLAESLRAAGHEAEVVEEPGDLDRLSTVAYLRRFAEFAPDLVVVINYGRNQLANVAPDNVPWFNWIQDPMAHLFSEDAGAAVGSFDFVAGHIYPQLLERFGYPPERTLHSPVVASARKFADPEIDPALLDEHACEVAYVSHHSETPDALHARLRRTLTNEPTVVRIIDALRERIDHAFERDGDRAFGGRLVPMIRETAAGVAGRECDARTRAVLMNQFVAPYLERLLRHRMVAWATSIARRRGWRFRLYGKGWERHEAFAAAAAGPIEHGEALRASYRAATAHLHASKSGLAHQRVVECALAGGLPLCQRTAAMWNTYDQATAQRLSSAGAPWVASLLADRRALHDALDHPDGWGRTAWGQRAGEACLPLTGRTRASKGPEPEHTLAWLLGDPRETTFADEAELEAALSVLIESPRRRASLIGGVRARAASALTTDRFAQRLTAWIGSGLASASG